MGSKPRQIGWLEGRLRSPEFVREYVRLVVEDAREDARRGVDLDDLRRIFAKHEAAGHTRLIRRDGEPYLWRCYLGGRRTGPGRAYLHRFVASDEPFHHNHPWDESTSVILAGSYVEHRLTTVRNADNMPCRVGPERHITCERGAKNTIYRDTFHWIELVSDEVWTLFVPGRRVGPWGFLDGGEYVPHEHWDDWKAGKAKAEGER